MVLGRQLYKYNIDKQQEFALLQCPSCKHPVIQSRVTYRRQKAFKFMPDTYVQHIENIPYELLQDYREAHGSYDNRHYKSCEMMCRNILQGIAVDKGAEVGKSFVFYINYLVNKGYVAPRMQSSVDLIRSRANETIHENLTVSEDRAKETLMPTTMLLRIIYEFIEVN
jgi:hypothetical protein